MTLFAERTCARRDIDIPRVLANFLESAAGPTSAVKGISLLQTNIESNLI